MRDARSWIVAVLAAVSLAIGVGAGMQITRSAPQAQSASVIAVIEVAPTSSAPTSAAVAPTTRPVPSTASAPMRTAVLSTTKAPALPRRSTPRTTASKDNGPVIFGQTNAEAYRQCVRSPNSPGAAECKRITDAGGRGE